MKKKRIVLAGCLIVLAAVGIFAALRINGDEHCYVTQYADMTGLQGMFYTVETEDGGLIVIDSGNAGNAAYVVEVIEAKGQHMDAWILTHPHPDHVGAFNEAWKLLEDDVDRVYTIEMDYAAYQAKAQEWDGFEVYEQFLELMDGSDKLIYVHTGDSFEICGLSCEVLSAYDASVDQITRDLCNDGSMMFKLTNHEESMLFCSDVGIGMSDRIMAQYGDKLKCDYIQMGHHGNGGLSADFYRLTQPKGAFFDAPEWLMNPAEGASYTTPQNRQLMEEMGAEIYYYATAPNRIILK